VRVVRDEIMCTSQTFWSFKLNHFTILYSWLTDQASSKAVDASLINRDALNENGILNTLKLRCAIAWIRLALCYLAQCYLEQCHSRQPQLD
jgi:hypothetical protein